MTNKEKFLLLVSDDKNNTMDYIRKRIENREKLIKQREYQWKIIDDSEELKLM